MSLLIPGTFFSTTEASTIHLVSLEVGGKPKMKKKGKWEKMTRFSAGRESFGWDIEGRIV
jgi:hypothetical protein